MASEASEASGTSGPFVAFAASLELARRPLTWLHPLEIRLRSLLRRQCLSWDCAKHRSDGHRVHDLEYYLYRVQGTGLCSPRIEGRIVEGSHPCLAVADSIAP